MQHVQHKEPRAQKHVRYKVWRAQEHIGHKAHTARKQLKHETHLVWEHEEDEAQEGKMNVVENKCETEGHVGQEIYGTRASKMRDT